MDQSMSNKNRAGGTLGHLPATPLRALDDLEVAEGYPDIRGWEASIAGTEGNGGKVEELLVDTDAMRVSHVVVRLDERRSMVPIEAVELQADGRRVFIRDAGSMQEVPSFGKARTDAVAAAIGVVPEGPVATNDDDTSERRRPIVDGVMRADEVAKRELRVPVLGEEVLAEPTLPDEKQVATRNDEQAPPA
jgi:hypothetical protein